jgi:hypothetical protein
VAKVKRHKNSRVPQRGVTETRGLRLSLHPRFQAYVKFTSSLYILTSMLWRGYGATCMLNDFGEAVPPFRFGEA